MPTLSAMRTDVRSRLVEPTARFFTDAEIDRWINFGYHDFISRTEWTEKISVQKVVANKFEYDLPTDIVKVNTVTWQDKYKLREADYQELHSVVALAHTAKNVRPIIYFTYPWDKKIRVYPIPSATGPATTINQVGGITSSSTSVTVASTTNFPSWGRILIENEQILYFDKNSTQFLQLVRGDGFTTAASHADATAVDEGRIQVYHFYDPPDLTSSDTPRISANWHEALIHYAVHVGLQKRDKYTEANSMLSEYLRVVGIANEERRKQQNDRNYEWKDPDMLENTEFGVV